MIYGKKLKENDMCDEEFLHEMTREITVEEEALSEIEWDIDVEEAPRAGVLFRERGRPIALVAFRAEISRYLRISRVYGMAFGLIYERHGDEAAYEFSRSITLIGDYKGDFEIKWINEQQHDKFFKFVDEALTGIGGEDGAGHNWPGMKFED